MTASPVGPASGSGAFDNAPLAAAAIWDDFDGPPASKPNSELWKLDTINQGGVQTYIPDNVFLTGSGRLVLRCLKTANGYTSGRITSRTKFNMQYGRVSASIKVPAGHALFPAFWLLGFQTPNNYPEIDIFEFVNNATTWYSTVHLSNKTGALLTQGPTADLSVAFHEYWLEWRRDSITTGVDSTTWSTWTPASYPGQAWTLNAPMYLIMNLAVGGAWAGPPDSTTPAQSDVLVDWFRYTPW